MRVRSVLGVLVAAMMLSSCVYLREALYLQKSGGSIPWWCNSTEEIPVTEGPAMGSVDYYAGTHKTPLSWKDCTTMSGLFDLAEKYVQQFPTAGEAEAAGFRMATPYVPGMGTHHVRGGITPEMLAAPGFNRFNPNFDAAGLDSVFTPMTPEVLQYDGNTPSAELVGFDYYVRTNTGLPPEGFAGNNDWWHIHPWICFRSVDAYMVAFNVTDSTCSAMSGINVNMANFYMLHVWVEPDMKFEPDVFAGMIPCISGGTAIHDPDHSCHTSRP